LFAIDPARQATLTRLVPRGIETNLDGMAFLYEVSPDGKRIAFPDENGRIGVFTIATGEWVWAQGIEDDKDLRTVPVWRSATELCFAAPTEAGERKAQIVLYDVETKTSRIISAAWPDEMVKKFLTD
jgi:hypothetical protein